MDLFSITYSGVNFYPFTKIVKTSAGVFPSTLIPFTSMTSSPTLKEYENNWKNVKGEKKMFT